MKRIFLNEALVIYVILLNCIILFIEGFYPNNNSPIFAAFNAFFAAFYITESIVKIKALSFKGYISKGINKLDFLLSIISVPELLALLMLSFDPDLSFLYALRAFRLVRGIRLLKILGILKNGENLLLGITRALKSSYLILLLFILINFILSTIAFHLFHEKSPDFENPLAALYSVFKIFTVEGWYEIPEQISTHYGFWGGWFVRLFFIVILFIGGIFGLSIVNAVFVEGMVNNDNTDNKLDEVLERLERIEKNQNPPIDKE